MARIFASSDIGAEALELLRRAGHDVEVHPDESGPSHSELREAVASGIDVLISTLRDPVDREVLEAGQGRLRAVAQDAVGVDNVDVEAASRLGIVVCNTPGVLTEATAEFALFLLGAAARRLRASEELVREGCWSSWHPHRPFLGEEVTGSTVAVVGCGRIGRAFAAKCLGLDVHLRLVSGGRDETWLGQLRDVQAARSALGRPQATAHWASLEEALTEADFVSLHVPLVSGGERSTERLIGAPELARMGDRAWLINTARGAVVDEAALIDALSAGAIGGAALDVFEREPLPLDSPLLSPQLRERVVLAHHFGSGTRQTRLSVDPERGMAGRTVASVLDALSDAPEWPFAVNPPG